MAQTKERTQPEAKSPPKSPAKATQRTATPTATKPSAFPASARSWLTRLRGPFTTAPTTAPTPDGKPRQRVGGTLFKSFFGILIWFVASQFIMYGLLLLDGALKQPGQLPPLEATHLLPPNTPLLGWITPFLLLYGGAVIGLWFLLIRFNLIPRDFFGARAQARQREQRQATAATSSGASTGPRKTRSQRRYAETQAQAPTTKGSGKGNGASSAKPATKAIAKPVAKASERQKTQKTQKASVPTVTNDQEYERVRSAERLRRRRESKR